MTGIKNIGDWDSNDRVFIIYHGFSCVYVNSTKLLTHDNALLHFSLILKAIPETISPAPCVFTTVLSGSWSAPCWMRPEEFIPSSGAGGVERRRGAATHGKKKNKKKWSFVFNKVHSASLGASTSRTCRPSHSAGLLVCVSPE